MLNFIYASAKFAFITALFYGCSFSKTRDSSRPLDPYQPRPIHPVWYNTAPKFQLTDNLSRPLPHLFFDGSSDVDYDNAIVFPVIIERQKSEGRREFDMNSGQIFTVALRCRSDLSAIGGADFHRLPFSRGLLPKILDRTGRPMEVVVFGELPKANNRMDSLSSDHDLQYVTRVVGGYEEAFCPLRLCQEPGQWQRRPVLLAVAANDDAFDEVTDLIELKKQLEDWERIKKLLISYKGQSFIYGNFELAYSYEEEYSRTRALEILKTQAKFFDLKQMQTLKRSCYKLYDLVEKASRTKLKSFVENIDRFEDELQTCQNFVYQGSINFDPEQFWFFIHFKAYLRLRELGYHYDCVSSNWLSSSSAKKIRGCSNESFLAAMQSAPEMLQKLINAFMPSARFVDYDRHPGGTHQKIYSLVDYDGKILQCERGKTGKLNNPRYKTMPVDVKWKNPF